MPEHIRADSPAACRNEVEARQRPQKAHESELFGYSLFLVELLTFSLKACIMQRILVPTDFSPAARNALDYAIQLANHFGSRITLLSTYRAYSNAGTLVDVEDYMKQDSAEEMLTLIKPVEPLLENGALLDSKIVHGDPAPAIASYAKQEGYDLIVMGTTGATGLKEIFTGSTTNAVIKAATVPVLAVPTQAPFRHLRNMILAIDEKPITSAKVTAALRELAQVHSAHIYVFHQMVGDDSKGVDPSVGMYLDGLEASIHYELDPEDVNTSLEEFVKEHPADLLVMVRRKRSFFEGLFHRSVTAREVFHSGLPMLILHDEA